MKRTLASIHPPINTQNLNRRNIPSPSVAHSLSHLSFPYKHRYHFRVSTNSQNLSKKAPKMPKNKKCNSLWKHFLKHNHEFNRNFRKKIPYNLCQNQPYDPIIYLLQKQVNNSIANTFAN